MRAPPAPPVRAGPWRRAGRGSARPRAGVREARPSSMAAVRVRPAALPEGELGEVAVVETEPAVLAQRGARGLEVRARGVELAAADLDDGADDEQRVREARGDAAERGGAEPVGLVPVADSRAAPRSDSRRARGCRSRTGASPRVPSCPSRADSRGRPSIVSASVKLTYARSRPTVDRRSPRRAAAPDEDGRDPPRRGRGRRGRTPSTVSARTSASPAPTRRASASACSAIGNDSAWRQAIIKPPASDPSEYARSGEGGSAGTSSTARSISAKPASLLPISYRYSPRSHMEERRTVRVRGADELDRSPCQLERARRGARFGWRVGCPGAELGEVEPDELGRVRHSVPERERPLEMRESLREAEDGLRLPCRLDRGGKRLPRAIRRGPVRGELSGRRSFATRELVGELRVEFLALAGQDRRVDRLREQGVAEAETAGGLVGDEDAVLDCLGAASRARHARAAQRRRGGAGSSTSRPAAAASRNRLCVAASSRATRCSSRSRSPRGSSPPLVAGRKELFGEEGIALGAGDDRVRRAPVDGVGRNVPRAAPSARRASSGPSSSEERRARAADAVGESAHSLRRGGLVGAVGREQQDPLVRRGCARGRRRDRASTYRPSAGPRARAAPAPPPRDRPAAPACPRTPAAARPPPAARLADGSPSGRSASTNGWYGSSVPTRSIDRPSRTSNPASRARLASSDARRRLADARFAGDENGRAASGPGCVERALELPELAYASDEDGSFARATTAASIAQPPRW